MVKFKDDWRWYPTTITEIGLFVGMLIFLFFGLFSITVPVHEFGHAGIAMVQGREILSMHWGADTAKWVADTYDNYELLGNPLEVENKWMPARILGVCMISGAMDGDDELAHQMYEIWWLAVISFMSINVSYIGMAAITRTRGYGYRHYKDNTWTRIKLPRKD